MPRYRVTMLESAQCVRVDDVTGAQCTAAATEAPTFGVPLCAVHAREWRTGESSDRRVRELVRARAV